VDHVSLRVVKRDGRRDRFDPAKLLAAAWLRVAVYDLAQRLIAVGIRVCYNLNTVCQDDRGRVLP